MDKKIHLSWYVLTSMHMFIQTCISAFASQLILSLFINSVFFFFILYIYILCNLVQWSIHLVSWFEYIFQNTLSQLNLHFSSFILTIVHWFIHSFWDRLIDCLICSCSFFCMRYILQIVFEWLKWLPCKICNGTVLSYKFYLGRERHHGGELFYQVSVLKNWK